MAALDACLAVNAPLLHRVVTKKPLGVLKYAMTLDGKIATAQVRAGQGGAGRHRLGGGRGRRVGLGWQGGGTREGKQQAVRRCLCHQRAGL